MPVLHFHARVHAEKEAALGGDEKNAIGTANKTKLAAKIALLGLADAHGGKEVDRGCQQLDRVALERKGEP